MIPCTNFHWTSEKFGDAKAGYALRDTNGNAISLIMVGAKGWEFYAQLLEPGLPLSGPYQTRQECADFISGHLVRKEVVSPDSVFGKLPKAGAV